MEEFQQKKIDGKRIREEMGFKKLQDLLKIYQTIS